MTVVWLAALAAQALVARYDEAALRCAVFREVVRTEVSSSAGPVRRVETAGREGVLFLRAAPGDSGIAVELWYDTLVVWREGPEGRVTPDTDGLVGGRWHGWLDRRGRYTRRAVPFIPDEVAEIADLRGIPDDFLPRLPDTALTDPVYHWRSESASDSTTVVDSLAVPVHRESAEAGQLTWDSRRGPVRWERTITVTARIPAGGPFRRGVVSTVKQLVRVERAGDACRTD